jgi:hypothetical protein
MAPDRRAWTHEPLWDDRLDFRQIPVFDMVVSLRCMGMNGVDDMAGVIVISPGPVDSDVKVMWASTTKN